MSAWLDDFLNTVRGSLFVRIDNDYLMSSSNYYDLKSHFCNFSSAVDLIRVGSSDKVDPSVEKEAMVIYGMLHARYLMTESGIQAMYAKYKKKEFQQCPRAFCKGFRCLPYGLSEKVEQHSVRMFCPNCFDVYNAANTKFRCIDGAFFGSNYIHMFLEKYKNLVSNEPKRVYVPKIFGFKIYHPGDEYSSSDEKDSSDE